MAAEILCACGCGEPVGPGRTWRRGHQARGRAGGGAVDFDVLAAEAESFGDIVDIGGPEISSAGLSGPTAGPHTPPAHDELPISDAGGGSPPGPDEPPAHARTERRGRRRLREEPAAPGPRKPVRVTQAIRGDIESKISFALEIPGRVWQAKDPVCGTVFIEQRPEMAAALTEIVCGSPDLLAWFSGQGGQFMLWLNFAAACWPVATVIMAHHVYHTVEAGPPPGYEQAAPDMSRYAA